MFGRTLRGLCLLMLWTCPLSWAAEPGCARYSELGLSLGMSNKSVWQTMGKRGVEAGRTRDSSGYRSIERYDKNSPTILVHYDGAVGKKSSARVVSIETTFEESVVDVPGLMATLRTRLGQPTSGAANLDDGLESGPVEWTDPACDVQVTLFRRAAPWWEPHENAEFHVKIDSLSFVRSGELKGKPLRAAGVPEPQRIR
jgi:hypothetical protein